MIKVRNAEFGDLHQISSIHKERFSDHFLGKFSKSLIEKFYLEFLTSEFAFFVATEGDSICGFVLGGEERYIDAAMSRFKSKNRMQSIIEVMARPKTWKDCYEKFKRKVKLTFRRHKKKKTVSNIPPVSLLSIATSKSYERRGIGTLLAKEFDAVIFGNYPLYHLYVHDNNYNAIEFYKKRGYKYDYSFRNAIAFKKCKE